MNRRRIVSILIVFWLIAFGGGFLAFQATPPTGDGFTHGMNRIATFFGWHIAASALAFASFFGGLGLPDGVVLRRLSRLPLMIFVAEIAALGLLYVTVMMRG